MTSSTFRSSIRTTAVRRLRVARALLAELEAHGAPDPAFARALLEDLHDSRAKLYVTCERCSSGSACRAL